MTKLELETRWACSSYDNEEYQARCLRFFTYGLDTEKSIRKVVNDFPWRKLLKKYLAGKINWYHYKNLKPDLINLLKNGIGQIESEIVENEQKIFFILYPKTEIFYSVFVDVGAAVVEWHETAESYYEGENLSMCCHLRCVHSGTSLEAAKKEYNDQVEYCAKFRVENS